jgi:hypothetical protein
MDDDRTHRLPDGRTSPLRAPNRAGWRLLLTAALATVAVLTLTPEGTGWSWGAPLNELRWYATGLGSESTVVQLLGNVGLMVVPAALAVLLWPSVGRFPRLAGAALATGTGIELLQWVLPLGRVVSPMDAVLNAGGAVAAGLLTARAQPAALHWAGVASR